MSVRIVTHCWAGDLPQYAQFLKYQVSSLVLYRPRVKVGVTVCYCRDDADTMKVLQGMISHTTIKDFDLRGIAMSKEKLGRRSIGRNIAAKAAEEDIVWFADVDMVFREGCLDELYAQFVGLQSKNVVMVYPTKIKIHKDHETGDRAVENARKSALKYVDVKPEDFGDKTYNRAIGGVQIVWGDFARKHGYLDGDMKWQQPRTDGKPFGDFRDDIAYRKFCSGYGRVQGIQLPGVYRLRHTKTTYQ